MPESDRSTRATIEIEGRELDTAIVPDLERVVVDDHLHLPDMFEITLRDHARDVLDRTNLRIGAKVKISAPALGSTTAEVLVTGEVTSVEAAYTSSGSKVIVRGYDHAHRLTRGRRTETYRNVKCSDVARTVTSRAGLEAGTIDDSGEVLDYIPQANQTDMEFLRGLARPIGFEVAVLDGKLDFRRPTEASEAPGTGDFSSTDPTQLVFGQDLLEFRPRVTSGGQVSEVQVRGWSVADKAALVGTAQGGTTSASLPDDPAGLASRFGSPTQVVVDRALGSQRAVDDAARAKAEAIGSAFAEATGTARGNPALKAGKAVSVSLVAAPFTGRYTLTHTRHVFDEQAGYRTEIVVSGRQERSLLGLASGGVGGASAPAVAGVVIGVVTDAADPDKMGRVKLKFPWLADDFETDWARVTMLGAGPDRGAVFIPEVNDEVLVAFEHGDFRAPFVIGGLWNGQDAAPDHDTSNGLQERTIVSRLGNKVILVDKDGSAGIRLVTAGGQYEIVLDEGASEVVVKAGGGKVRIEAQQDVALEATGKLTLKGTGGVEITSNANVDISATGNATVKGAMVQLG